MRHFLLIFLTLPLFGADPDHSQPRQLRLRQEMSSNEFQACGLHKINSQELATLEVWISKYVQDFRDDDPRETGIFKVMRIDNRGRLVLLEDGSAFQISSFDYRKSALWQTGHKIQILNSKHKKSWPYTLYNIDTRQSVYAKIQREGSIFKDPIRFDRRQKHTPKTRFPADIKEAE